MVCVCVRRVDLSSPLLHSKLEETTIHLSRMLQVREGVCFFILFYFPFPSPPSLFLFLPLSFPPPLTPSVLPSLSFPSLPFPLPFLLLLPPPSPSLSFPLPLSLSQVNATLQELHLSKHNITDTGMEWLCRHLHDNTALLHLNISW